MGHSSKLNAVKDILSTEKPNIFMIHETKINEYEMGKIIHKIRNYDGIALQETGASRRICTIWRKDIRWLQHQQKYQHWIKTELRNKVNEEKICVFNIYAPNHYRERERQLCWNSLKDILLHD